MRPIPALPLLAAVLVPLHAGAITLFTAALDSAQEVAPAGASSSTATGTGQFALSDDGSTLTYEIRFSGVDFSSLAGVDAPDDPVATAAALHFHDAARGANGGVVFGIFGPAQDDDDRSVSFDAVEQVTLVSGVWDLDDPATSSLSNFAAALQATAPGNDTSLYVNLHAPTDAAGLIRGQLVAAPEPTTGALLAIGVAALAVARRTDIRRPR